MSQTIAGVVCHLTVSLMVFVTSCVLCHPPPCDIDEARYKALIVKDGTWKQITPTDLPDGLVLTLALTKAAVANDVAFPVGGIEDAYKKKDGGEICFSFRSQTGNCISTEVLCTARSTDSFQPDVTSVCHPIVVASVFTFSGNAIQITPDDKLRMSSDSSNPSQFLQVPCLASGFVSPSELPRCVSFMDANRPGWYVRHYQGILYVDPRYGPHYPGLFDQDASFLVHPDTFYPGSIAFESVDPRNYFIRITNDRLAKIRTRGNALAFPQAASFRVTDLSTTETCPCSSCKEIYELNVNVKSGVYTLQTASSKTFQAFCDMETNGGGYTFILPEDFARLTDAELQTMFTDRQSFLMRVQQLTGPMPRETIGVLKQLPQYSGIPLMLGLNQYTNYEAPWNINYLSLPFLYCGFLPIDSASNKGDTQGLQVNGVEVTFTNCDGHPNSYFALFVDRVSPTDYSYPDTSFGNALISKLSETTPDTALPADYFMFLETHWGGCGCYLQTDGRANNDVTGAAVGFR